MSNHDEIDEEKWPKQRLDDKGYVWERDGSWIESNGQTLYGYRFTGVRQMPSAEKWAVVLYKRDSDEIKTKAYGPFNDFDEACNFGNEKAKKTGREWDYVRLVQP